VRDALVEVLVSGFEVGAALAVCVDGKDGSTSTSAT
jgi:hypothetical protein